jgi:type I restriction enzyme S subunit
MSLLGRRFVANAGQFITSRIDARNGAMGLVPKSLDGALVTNDFPLFDLNTERLEPRFLDWLCRTAISSNFVGEPARAQPIACA